MSDRVDMLRTRLTEALEPTRLDIIDQSAAHAGHEGAKGGGGGSWADDMCPPPAVVFKTTRTLVSHSNQSKKSIVEAHKYPIHSTVTNTDKLEFKGA